jgi:hypothetical protein
MKQFKQAITFGRFNLLHRGHTDLFQRMSEAADQVKIGLSTGPKNILYRTRADVIEKWSRLDAPDVNLKLIPKLQPFDLLSELPITLNPVEVVFFVGEDQYKLAKAVERSLGFSTRIIPRLTSSTLVRQAIDNEEWDLLSGMIPGSIINDVIQLHLTNA